MDRGIILTGSIITLAASLVLYNAYSIDNQFYAMSVYIFKSPSNIAVHFVRIMWRTHLLIIGSYLTRAIHHVYDV
jgi:hypothetical protein